MLLNTWHQEKAEQDLQLGFQRSSARITEQWDTEEILPELSVQLCAQVVWE